MLLLGYENDYKTNLTFWDKVELLPRGNKIIQREIEKAVTGKPFFFNDENGLPVRLPGVSWEDFLYYYVLWENFENFGLPKGRGWIDEREWLLSFLKIFNRTYKDVEYFLEQKEIKKNAGN